MRTIYVELDDNDMVEGWSSTKPMNEHKKVDLPENHPFFLGNFLIYRFYRGGLYKNDHKQLEIIKQHKGKELNQACEEAILAGFSQKIKGTTYHFSYDEQAQTNFQGTEIAFTKGLIKRIGWTVKKDNNYKRIFIDQDDMNLLSIAVLRHKNDKITHYRNVLSPLIEQAKTTEEVEQIHWEMDLSQFATTLNSGVQFKEGN